MGAGPFQLSPGSEAPPGAGLSTAAVTMTQPLFNHMCVCPSANFLKKYPFHDLSHEAHLETAPALEMGN